MQVRFSEQKHPISEKLTSKEDELDQDFWLGFTCLELLAGDQLQSSLMNFTETKAREKKKKKKMGNYAYEVLLCTLELILKYRWCMRCWKNV